MSLKTRLWPVKAHKTRPNSGKEGAEKQHNLAKKKIDPEFPVWPVLSSQIATTGHIHEKWKAQLTPDLLNEFGVI
jgi:macrodomain Ter protein organizer (MatP/YcbG family)